MAYNLLHSTKLDPFGLENHDWIGSHFSISSFSIDFFPCKGMDGSETGFSFALGSEPFGLKGHL